MVVFSIGVLGVIRLQLESIRVNRFGGHMTQAALLAEERAETLQQLDFFHPLLADTKNGNNPATDNDPFPSSAKVSLFCAGVCLCGFISMRRTSMPASAS